MKRCEFILYEILRLVFIIAMFYSAYGLLGMYDTYEKEKEMHLSIIQYGPDLQIATDTETYAPKDMEPHVSEPQEETVVNKGVLDLQIKCPDVAGWISIPNTGIDYPFVRSEDNAYYLCHDIEGNYSKAGTIFMDCRCNIDMTSQNTIIYGHNLKNHSMFGTLELFNDKSFFDKNSQGTIYLPYSTFVMEFFAYMVVNAETEKKIYDTTLNDGYYEYIKDNARYLSGIDITAQDKIITLSTCSYEFENARTVLLAKIKS